MDTLEQARRGLGYLERICPRRLWQAALPYAAFAWVVLQLGDVLGETWGWSAGALQAMQILVAGGLVVTLVVAWFHGEPGRQPVRPLEIALLLVVGGMAVGGAAWRTTAVSAAVLPVGTGQGGLVSVAVAPFEHEGGAEADRVFAQGMRDGVVSNLMGVPGIRVIALEPGDVRGSTAGEVATRVGADFVVSGRFGSRGGRMTNRVELTGAGDVAGRAWSRTYRNAESMDDLVAVQRNVAVEVAAVIGSGPTALGDGGDGVHDMEAYRRYLEGSSLFDRRFDLESMRAAVAAFEAALAREPDFAAALASLVHAHAWLSWQFQESGGKRAARGYLDRLYALDPDRVETHLAAAYYHYYATRDFDSALRELRVVVRRRPGDVWAWAVKGYVERRLGLWESSLDSQRRAAELDPSGAQVAYNLGRTLHRLGRYAEAEVHLRRALRLEAGRPLYVHGIMSLQLARGDTAAMRESLEEARRVGAPGSLYDEESWLLSLQGRHAEALAALSAGRDREPPGSWHRSAAVLAWNAGDMATARIHADSLQALAQAELAEAREGSGGPRPNVVLAELAVAAAILGERDLAQDYARHSVDPLAASADAYDGSSDLYRLALTWMILGEHERALETLGTILSAPSPWSRAAFEVMPVFEPLRELPGWDELPEGYGPLS